MADSGCEDTVPTAPAMSPKCKLPEESDASMRARLFTSLSQSFPHSQLYKALHGEVELDLNGNQGDSEDDDDSLYGDHLSNSCFASLRMDRRDSDDIDDDLHSLEWLQREDLLKNIGGEILDRSDTEDSPGAGEQKENEDVKPDLNMLQNPAAQQPPHLPYMPQKHVNSKPPYSFSCLIFMAVEASPQKRLPVKDIYNWILTQFPYFQNAPTGWKNSVRHNLSLNKCFKKVEKDKGQSIGKGSLWCIDPAYRPNLLQALRKTPYHPYHQLQMTSTQPQNYMLYQSLPGSRTVLPLTQRPVPNTVSPHLFPFLSRRLAQTSFDVDNEMKDVAQTLVALKGSIKKEMPDPSVNEDTGPTWKHHKRSYRHCRSSSPVIVTNHPSLDHAYSSSRILEDDAPSHSSSSSSSIDEEYDFGDADEECESDYQSDMEWDSDDRDEVDGDVTTTSSGNGRRGKLKIDIPEEGKSGVDDNDDDEQKKLHEGASALLNLAGLLMDHNRERIATFPSSDTSKQRSGVANKGRGRKHWPSKSQPDHKDDEKTEDMDKEQVKRPFNKSKRKNAGSNAKYDNEDYALGKLSKASGKSHSPLAAGKKRGSQALKASGNKPTRKVSKAISKVKVSEVGKKKSSDAKKKLKLSKVFGKKANNTSVENKPKSVKKCLSKNVLAKNNVKRKAVASSNKPKPLISFDKTAEAEAAASLTSLASPVLDRNSSGDLKKEESKSPQSGAESDGTLTQLAYNNNNNNNNNDSSKDSLPTASGDAPIKLKGKSEYSPSQDRPASPHSRTPPPLSVSSLGAIHKSPHFTRFSKKKSALS